MGILFIIDIFVVPNSEMKYMKYIKVLLIFLFSLAASFADLNAQGSSCFEADGFCSDENYEFNNTTNNGVGPNGINYSSCTYSPGFTAVDAKNPIWYYFQVEESGTLELTVNQYGNSGQGLDTDFMLWGPFDTVEDGCQQIHNGLATIQCGLSMDNYEEITLGMPGGSYNSGFFSTQHGMTTPPPGVEGGIYIAMITNFDNQPGYFTFEQTGGTGSVDCSVVEPCQITNVTAVLGACDPATNTFSISGTIEFEEGDEDNAPTTGNLIVEDCNGNSSSYPVSSVTSPFTYTIDNILSDGEICTITAYFSDAPNCSASSAEYTNPKSCIPCDITSVEVTLGECNEDNNEFGISGTVEFEGAPETGQLIVSDCNGNQQVFNAPFTSPTNFSINGIDSDGNTCEVTVYFTDETACTATSDPYENVKSCTCTAEIGTFSASIEGQGQNEYLLCYGDEIKIQSNDDWIPADEIDNGSDPNVPDYDPGLAYLAFSCPPIILPPADFQTDPCFLGLVDVADAINLLNDGPAEVNGVEYSTIYYVALTLYNKEELIYSYTYEDSPSCFALGEPFEVTFLPEIMVGLPYEDCTDKTSTATITGGWPEVEGNQTYTLSHLKPSSLNFVKEQISNGEEIEIIGLKGGNYYNYDVTDANGCSISVSNGPFLEGPIADFTIEPDTIKNYDNSISFTNQSEGGTTYTWVFGDGDISTETDPVHEYQVEYHDSYVAILYVEDEEGCIDSLAMLIPVLEDLIYYVPNTFTPDEDGFNEEFKPVFTAGFIPSSYVLSIYNRWGELIFESFDPENGWKGIYGDSNLPVPDGTYVWKIRYERKQIDSAGEIVGHVNVIR